MQVLPYLKGKFEIPGVKIQRGILQGDNLSPLRFCLALNPPSNLINEQGHGYNLTCNRKMTKETRKATHLLYMDDLKLSAPNEKKLANQLKLVKQYSEDIRKEFGQQMCIWHMYKEKQKEQPS